VHEGGICRLINEVFIERPTTLAQNAPFVNPLCTHQVVFIDKFSSLPELGWPA
jgi:hypothetical protein